jgi:hypothetical protein
MEKTMFDYSYKFYFPDYKRPAVHGYGIGVDNWPFNKELQYQDSNWCDFFQTHQFTSTDTGYIEDNAKQLNYYITNERPTGAYFYYVNLDTNRLGQLDFFCSAFRRDSGYMTWQLPDDVAEDVDNGRCKIVLDNSLEGFPVKNFDWDVFYERTKLKPENFIFVTGDFSLSLNDRIPTVYRNSWERSMMRYTNIRDLWQKRMYEHCANRLQRPFKGIALNRLMRPHRIMIAKLINDRKLQSAINYSFGIVTHHGDNAPDVVNRIPEQVENIVAGTSQIFGVPYELLENFVHEHGEKNIIQEEGLNLHINQATNYENAILQAYDESYFSLVAETNYYQKTIFQSEKIFKPIMMLQPFVVAAEPGAIQAMRDLGYDVFDDYLNHSYDEIKDHMERMIALFNEVERLSAIPHKTWQNWRFEMLPRNQQNLAKLQNASFKYNTLHEPVYKGSKLKFASHH